EDFFLDGVIDEVIVVDNNSRDRTAAEASATRARVVRETAQGYGHALRRGLREATGDLVIMAEPDGTFVGRDVLKLLAYAEDFEMVCGTRTTRELIWKQRSEERRVGKEYRYRGSADVYKDKGKAKGQGVHRTAVKDVISRRKGM